jgi:hypothetical protein
MNNRFGETFKARNMTTPNMVIEKFIKNKFFSNIQSNSDSMLRYLLKALVMCLCLIGCFWQIGLILKLYFSYPATVLVSVENMDNLQLPGITLCNNNRFVLHINSN